MLFQPLQVLCRAIGTNRDMGTCPHQFLSEFPFLTAILHRGLRNDFFFNSNLLFPIFIWTFIFPFLFGLLFSFFLWTFIFSLDFYLPFPFFRWTFIFPFLFGRLFNRGHILDFFQIFNLRLISRRN